MNKKRKVTKRLAAWFMCLAMVLTTINLPAFSVDVKAAETVTVTSSITIDGNEYALYTGFTATAGTDVSSIYVFPNMVDGDLATHWHPILSTSEDYSSRGCAYFEFSSDVPIILKGYILNSYSEKRYHPTDRRLYAKANEDDEYVLVSSYTNEDYSGTENSFPISNEDNIQYRYFRFEGANTNQNVWLNEIRLYGENELTYGFRPEKSATCTATGYKQDCYLRSDGKYFTDQTGKTELSEADVIAPIVPHTLEDETAHVSICSVCGQIIVTGPHIFLDENGETLDCICGEINPEHNHGYCGDPEVNDGKDVTWRVTQEEDGNYTLTISGSGKMADYDDTRIIPWNKAWNKEGGRNYFDKITKVVVSDGVTYVGHEAFWDCPGLKSVEIPSSVTAIGDAAFGNCDALTKVEMPCSLDYSSRWWGDESAFVKYHVYEGQPFIYEGDGTHYQNCKCGNTTSTPESHAFTVEDVTIDGANVSGATCTEKAKYYKSCVCGVLSTSEVFEVGEPHGHLFTEYISNGDATTEADGTKTAVCDHGCGETDTVIDEGSRIPYSCSDGRHSFADNAEVVKIDENKHGKLCTICHVVIVTGNHDFSYYEQSENNTHIVKCAQCKIVKPDTEPEPCSPSEEDPSQCVCGRKFGYPVTFNTNGGSAVEPASILVIDGEELGTLPTTTKAGYTFAGWYSDKELTKKVTASTICKGEMNLYAKWTANKYSIKFDGNKATSGTMTAISGTYKEGDVLPANTFKKTGYTFNGWKDADGKTYKNKASIAPLAVATKAKEVTLTAQWKKATYTITYELNGGTNAEANPATYTYTTADITLAKPTKKGYTFGGWFSDEALTKQVTEIKKGSTGNKTLYAKWTKTKYTITYNLNGGTNSADNPATYTVTTPTITLATPTRRGYKFSGWFSDEKFTTKVTEIAKGSTGKKTLYAKWAKNTYNITYVLNGGTNSADNPATYTVTTETITLAKPTKKGYTFKGWFTDKECTKAITEIKKGSTGSKTLYAKWSANSYNVKFNGNGATSGNMADVTGWKYGKEYELPANAFKKTGYTFKGWATTATGEVKYANKESVKNLSSTNNKTVNLYAIWAKTKYKITYNLDGGTNNAENPASFYYTTATITLKNPTKTGYTFGGWYSDAEFKTRVKTIEKGTLKSVTLYAKWTENSYSITFDANALEDETVTGSMDAITGCKYTQTVILPENAFEREGYTFVNWNTAADGSGTAYAAGEEVTGLTGKKNGTVTLYAQWSVIESAEPEVEDDALKIQNSEFYVLINKLDGFNGKIDEEDASKCTLLSDTDEKVASVVYDLEYIESFDNTEMDLAYAYGDFYVYYTKTIGEDGNLILNMYYDIGGNNYVFLTVQTRETEDTFDVNEYISSLIENVIELPEDYEA